MRTPFTEPSTQPAVISRPANQHCRKVPHVPNSLAASHSFNNSLPCTWYLKQPLQSARIGTFPLQSHMARRHLNYPCLPTSRPSYHTSISASAPWPARTQSQETHPTPSHTTHHHMPTIFTRVSHSPQLLGHHRCMGTSLIPLPRNPCCITISPCGTI
jgi:hypothetical protein